MTPAEAKQWIEANNIKYILAQFVDIHGAAKAKAVPVEHYDMVLGDGAGFAGFALWGFGMGPHGPDYMGVGDLSTLGPFPGCRDSRVSPPTATCAASRIPTVRASHSRISCRNSTSKASRCTWASSPSSCF